MPAKKFWDIISKMPNQTVKIPLDLESIAYSEWFAKMSLCSKDSVPPSAHDHFDKVASMFNALGEDARNFFIKGQGLDAAGISSSICRCIVNPRSEEASDAGSDNEMFSESASLNTSNGLDDLPVLWSIGHNAVATEVLVETLENFFPGLCFLCQYHADNHFTEEDSKLWNQIEALCQHPFTDDDVFTHSRALIGVDLSSIASGVPETLYVQPSVPWEKCASSLEVRMQAFSTDHAESFFDCMSEISDDMSEKDQDMSVDEKEPLKPVEFYDSLYKNAPLKVVDLGNGCWTYKHFTDDIQTRQYRSPEVILGAKYGTSADMWSLACIIFELLTGDLLFDPHSGESWDRDEDHIAMMSELLGGFPKKMKRTGKRASVFFNKRGDLRHIQNLKYWSLKDVLIEKYKLHRPIAMEIADFMEGLLEIDPDKRMSAEECLSHPWLSLDADVRRKASLLYRDRAKESKESECDEVSPVRKRYPMLEDDDKSSRSRSYSESDVSSDEDNLDSSTDMSESKSSNNRSHSFKK